VRRGRGEAWCRRLLDDASASVVSCLPSYLSLWGLILLSDVLSEPPFALARAVGIVLLGLLSVDAVIRRRRWVPLASTLVPGAILLLGSVCSIFQVGPEALAACVWVLGILSWKRHSTGVDGLRLIVALFGVTVGLLQAVPAVWSALNGLARAGTSGLFGWAGGSSLGYAASGLGLVMPFVPGLLCQGFDRAKGWLLAVAWGGGLLFVYAGLASLIGPDERLRLVTELVYVCIVVAVIVHASRRAAATRIRWQRGESLVATAALLLLAGLLFALPGMGIARREADSASVIQIVDQTLLGTWERPVDIAPGSAYAGAHFGLFPEYLEAFGHRVVRTEGMGEGIADGVDIVVIINPGEPFAPGEVRAIDSFVRSGGALLVLGDHTNMGGIMDHANGLTAPFGLSLAFDSAVSAASGWPTTLRAFSPFSDGLRGTEIPVSVGASVEMAIHPAIAPLLVGRRAFSDPGEDANVSRALLGNLVFDRGEPYGDIVLAAVRHLGSGKVVLFGDTSPFQNSALAHGYGFVDRLVHWTTNRSSAWMTAMLVPAAALLLALGVLFLWRSDGSEVVLMILAVGVGSVVGGAFARAREIEMPLATLTAQIDLTHGNAVRLEPLHPRGVESLGVSASRAGYVPLIRYEGLETDRMNPGDVILSLSPTRSFSTDEAEGLLSWVDRGGRLILATSWPQSRLLAPFLEPLGLTIRAIPLGAVRPDVTGLDVQPELPAAWPIFASDDWISIGTVPWDVEEYVVVAERQMGMGSIVVVGDGEVLTNESLEGKGYAYIENLRFVERLLSPPPEGGGP